MRIKGRRNCKPGQENWVDNQKEIRVSVLLQQKNGRGEKHNIYC